MKTCTFFGHRDAPMSLRESIKNKVTELIREQGVDLFYVGNHGQFDAMVLSVLEELAPLYPHIKYYVVLAYLPYEKTSAEHAILPEGIEFAHPRAAIPLRNEWMIERSDHVITYVTHPGSGAAKFKAMAEQMGKKVYNFNYFSK